MPEIISTRYEDLVLLLSRYGALWFYIFLFASAAVENLFPPYPGDTVTLIGGLLAVSGSLSFTLVLLAVCSGNLVGSLLLYSLGQTKGRNFFMQERGKFLNKRQLEKVENWFVKYGNGIILVSRFLAGVRSGVALAAGIGNVKLAFMIAYSLVSIVLWNSLILFSASVIHDNWRSLYEFTRIYNRAVLVVLVVGILITMFIYKRKNR